MIDKVKDFDFSRLRSLDFYRSFFMGKAYPAVIALLIFVGNVTGLEYYFNFIITGLLLFSLSICHSIRPGIIVFCAYVYQISLDHGPNYPNYSDFFYTGWRLPVSIIIICAVSASFIIFFFKNKMYKRISVKNTPFLVPLLAFSAALFLSGAFSDVWIPKNLLFGLFNFLVYFGFFIFIYHGFAEDESAEELGKYFAYVTLLISFILVGQVIHLYLTSDNVFIDGSINKVGVALGWGIWNLVGNSLAVLIPTLFYGVMVNKYPWLYFTMATLTYVAAVFTMSRNALVFATLAYGACIIISAFVGKHKLAFRIIIAVGIFAVALFMIVFFSKIKAILGDYFERGFSDNGRYSLWSQAFDNFLNGIVFGRGFYGFDVDTAVFGPLPKQAHNTVLQLLSSLGIVGLLTYAYYRVKTALIFFKKPNVMKTMLGISILTLLFGSLLDNFVFNIYPLLSYNVALAICAHSYKEDCVSESKMSLKQS